MSSPANLDAINCHCTGKPIRNRSFRRNLNGGKSGPFSPIPPTRRQNIPLRATRTVKDGDAFDGRHLVEPSSILASRLLLQYLLDWQSDLSLYFSVELAYNSFSIDLFTCRYSLPSCMRDNRSIRDISPQWRWATPNAPKMMPLLP